MDFELIPLVALVGFFGSIVLVVGLIVWGWRQHTQAQTQRLDDLLNRFDTAEEFVAFLQTEAGAQLVEAVATGSRKNNVSVVASLRRGIVCTALGVAFLILALYEGHFVIYGVLLLMLGIGFLVSAYVTRQMEGAEGNTKAASAAKVLDK